MSNKDVVELKFNDTILHNGVTSNVYHIHICEKELDLYKSQLSGAIPSEIGLLVNLKELYFGANQLSGTIPPEMGNLVNLRHLCLDNNQPTSADDFLIAAANNISPTQWKDTEINLSGNNLTISAAAQTAKQQLEANGCTVYI